MKQKYIPNQFLPFFTIITVWLLSFNQIQAQCPTATSLQTFCDTQLPTIGSLAAQDNGGGIAWFATATAATSLNPLMSIPIGTTDYYVDNLNGNCGNRQKVTAIVYGPPIGKNFQGICVDQASDATLSDLDATGNNVKWYLSPTGGVSLPTSAILTSNTIYYASQTNPTTVCETSRLAVYVIIGVSPVPTGNQDQTFCSNLTNPPKISDLVVSSTNVNWYDSLNSNSAIPANTLLINGASYYGASVNPPCESSGRFQVNVTLSPEPYIVTPYAIAICSGSTFSLTPLNGNGNIVPTGTLYTWTNPDSNPIGVITGGSAQPTPQTYIGGQLLTNTTTTNASITYTVTPSVGGCTGNPFTIIVTVNPAPSVLPLSDQIYCNNISNSGVIFNSTMSGSTFVWTNSNPSIGLPANGTGDITSFTPINTTQNPITATIGVTATANGCTGPVETFDIIVNPSPIVNFLPAAQVICTGNSTLAVNLTSSIPGSTISWTCSPPAGISGITVTSGTDTDIPIQTLINTTKNPITIIYRVIATASTTCPSTPYFYTITVNPLSDAGTDGDPLTICQTSPTKIDLFNSLKGSPQVGGIWTPTLESGTGVFNPAKDQSGTYTYTVTNLGCAPAFAQVNVTVQPANNSGTSNNVGFCENNIPTSIDLPLYLGTPDPNGTWSDNGLNLVDPISGKVNDTSTLAVTGSPYIFTYTVSHSSSCPIGKSTISVTINTPANAGTSPTVPTQLCKTSNPIDLGSLLGTHDQGGTWSPVLASGSGIFNPAVDPAGTYQYTIKGKPGCSNAFSSVTISVQSAPYAGQDTYLQLCQNSGPINLFSTIGGNPDPNGTWTPPLSGGTNIFDPSKYPAGQNIFIYTVNATAPCIGNDSATITIELSPPANAGANSSITMCQNGKPVNLIKFLGGTPDSGGTWNPVLPGGDLGTLDPSTLAPGTYAYTYTVQGKSGCPSKSAKITVTITAAPNAGTDGSVTACEDDGTIDLFSYLGNSPQTGGTWSPQLASGNGILDPKLDVEGTYTYTVKGTAPCANATAIVIVTINKTLSLSGGTLDTFNICPLEIQKIKISNINGLSNDIYTIGYTLTGTTSVTDSQDIQFTDGNATIFLNGELFLNSGSVTFTITQIAYPGGLCPTTTIPFTPINFEVLAVPTPEFKPESNVFCDTESPTIADLTSGITNGIPVIWYDSATNGSQLSDSTPLQDDATYYASGLSAESCENPNRIAITVNFNECDLAIPDGFSPNGDGINDSFVIPYLVTKYPHFKIEIFNRYGNVVFNGNKSIPDWDGKSNSEIKLSDSEIPTGVYFFVLEYNDGIKKPIQGRLYLSR